MNMANGMRREIPTNLFRCKGMWARFGKLVNGEPEWEDYKFYAFEVERDEDHNIVEISVEGRDGVFNPQDSMEEYLQDGDIIMEIEWMTPNMF